MVFNQGEVRKIGIEVMSEIQQDFVIESADYEISNQRGEIVETGVATIEEHKILTLFSAIEKGRWCCEFTYRIGPEIIKAKLSIAVI
ncbi:hypothetical protein [Crassaminicella profunda]|uniref:hypothetical protein n=1 Tax=Crassaminicella profunda TaxID=1286698 RepID=UPI001CA62A2A|nr:hypothetical protein [Crassaminicella profunda]QZY56722.1 hypothetical protein K7H06_07315 [Crassaminicella profunda]